MILKVKKVIKKMIIVLGGVFGIGVVAIIILMGMASKYNGIWCMEAYGLSFNINAGIVRAYEVTETSYTRVSMYDGAVLSGVLYCGLGKLELEKNNEQLILMDKGSQVNYKANKVSKDFFEKKLKVGEDDSQAKFKLFYETFKENYAFADKYGVNFDEEYQKYSTFITDDTDDETVFKYICEMVSRLDDGHVELSFKDKEYTPSDYKPEWITNKEQQDFIVNTLKGKYVKDYYKFEDCGIRYGTLREDVGYIIIQSLGMTDLNKTATTQKAMDKIIQEFQGKETIVIDLRFCSGGYDEASLLIAGYFTSNPYLAYKKQAYYKGNYTELQDIYVQPGELKYDGNVVIMTSGYTISAGETFIQAMLARPHHKIKIVGEETAGFYSDSIPKVLPGGFEFSMSTERYYSYDDLELEGNGVMPDAYLPVSVEDAKKGVDKAFEWILN